MQYKKRVVLKPDFFDHDFFKHERLSRWAAYNIAERAIEYSTLVAMIEGGIWHDPGFMPRSDCIWKSVQDEDFSLDRARKSNIDAANFIAQADMEVDTFILTYFHSQATS